MDKEPLWKPCLCKVEYIRFDHTKNEYINTSIEYIRNMYTNHIFVSFGVQSSDNFSLKKIYKCNKDMNEQRFEPFAIILKHFKYINI